MSKDDIQYLMMLIRERLRGWVEIPPDNVIREIIDDMFSEFKVIQEKERWMNKLEK